MKKSHFNGLLVWFSAIALAIVAYAPVLWAAKPVTYISACGPITASGSYELNADITATGDCIDVQVDRVDLSLAGYTIDGAGNSGRGIMVDGQSRVTITGPGLIKGFNGNATSAGIVIGAWDPDLTNPTNRVKVSGLIVTGNNDGVLITGHSTSDVIVENNVVISNDRQGIRILSGADDNTVARNEVLNNGTVTPAPGIAVEGGAGPDMAENNMIINNNSSFNATQNIWILSEAIGTVVDGNIAFGAGTNDIENDGTNTQLTNNTCFVGQTDECSAISDFNLNH